MGDRQHGATVGAQPVLQPVEGGVVEVVAGFVQQHELGCRGQQTGQAQPGLLAAGETAERPGAVDGTEAERLESHVRTGGSLVPAACLVRTEEIAVLGHPLLGEIRLQLPQPRFHGAQFGERRVDHLAHCVSGGKAQGLAEMADAAERVDGDGDRALVRRLLPGDQPQQRGLAGAVLADDGYVFAGFDGERDPVEHGASVVRLRDVPEGELSGQGG